MLDRRQFITATLGVPLAAAVAPLLPKDEKWELSENCLETVELEFPLKEANWKEAFGITSVNGVPAEGITSINGRAPDEYCRSILRT